VREEGKRIEKRMGNRVREKAGERNIVGGTSSRRENG